VSLETSILLCQRTVLLALRRGEQLHLVWREAKKTLAPKDMTVYQNETQRIIRAVTDIRRQVTGRQAVIDQVVLDLYGITDPDDRKFVFSARNIL